MLPSPTVSLAPCEVRHALAAAVGEEIWYMMKNNVLFDNERYFENIHRNYDLFVKARS